jgi:hypothetical protein
MERFPAPLVRQGDAGQTTGWSAGVRALKVMHTRAHGDREIGEANAPGHTDRVCLRYD